MANGLLGVDQSPSLAGSSSTPMSSSVNATNNRGTMYNGKAPGGRRMSVAAASVDVSSFSVPSFHPGLYVQYNLEGDSIEQISGLKKNLELALDRASGELQRTVQQRVGEFVRVTQELAGFEAQLNELHGIVNRLGSVSETLLANAPKFQVEPLQQDPEEVIVANPLDSGVVEPGMPAADLMERRARVARLAEQIEGLEERLVANGADANRQLLSETTAELQKKPVAVYILNDALLVTGKKASRNPLASASRKHAVELFLPFSASFSFSEAGELGVRVGEHVLAFGAAAGKKLWVEQLRKAIIAFQMEAAARNATLHLKLVKLRQAKKSSRTASSALNTRLPSQQQQHHKRTSSGLPEERPDIPDDKHRTLLDLLDNLEEASATRQYGVATDFVEQLAFNLDQLSGLSEAPRVHALRRSLEAGRRRLAALLLAEIERDSSSTLAGRNETITHVQLLLVLGCAEAARERFLAARASSMRLALREASASSCGRSIPKAIDALAEAGFSAIRAAADDYRAAFAASNEPPRMAGMLFWAHRQTVELGELVAKLVFPMAGSPALAPEEIHMALQNAKRHCDALQEIGMSLGSLLDDSLGPAFSDHLEAKTSVVREALNETDVIQAQDLINAFISEWIGCTIPGLSPILALHIGHLLEAASSIHLDKFTSSTSNSARQESLTSCELLADAFFNSIHARLQDTFIQDFVSLLRLQQRLLASIYAMYDILTETSAANWIPANLPLYSAPDVPEGLEETAPVSPWILLFLPQIARICKEAPKHRRPHLLAHLAKSLLVHLGKAIESGPIAFTSTGFEQLSLDLNFLRLAWKLDSDVHLQDYANTLIDRAAHSLPRGMETTKTLDWYAWHAQKLIDATSPALLNFGMNDD